MGKNNCPEGCGGYKHLERRASGSRISDSMAASKWKKGGSLSAELQGLTVCTVLLKFVIFITQDISYVLLYYCLTFYLQMTYFHRVIISSRMQGPWLFFFVSLSMNKSCHSNPGSAIHYWHRRGQVTWLLEVLICSAKWGRWYSHCRVLGKFNDI